MPAGELREFLEQLPTVAELLSGNEVKFREDDE